MAVRIQFRRGTAAEWSTSNPILAAGELGYEIDTASFKLGDGTLSWDSLAYGAVSEAYVDSALAAVVGLAPETLDTLNELASAIGNDPNFVVTIENRVSAHEDDTTGVHGIVDVAELETQTGAQSKSDAALLSATSYTDTSISNLVDSSPGTLNTLNELAAALGDDANFSTTLTTSLSTKLAYIVGISSDLETANAITEANTVYVESDTDVVRFGNGVTSYNLVSPVSRTYIDNRIDTHDALQVDVHGISDTTLLAYQTDITTVANSIDGHTIATTNVHGITDTSDLLVTADLDTHSSLTQDVHGISDTTLLAYQTDITTVANSIDGHTIATTNVHGITDTSNLAYLSDLSDLTVYAPLESPVIVVSATLPQATTIGDVSAVEISYLSDVTSGIQVQIDGKLAISVASTTYATLNSPTFTGTVVLPSDTSINGVSAAEIGYLSTATSDVQVQIDTKAPTASPTFTGTVSGVTAAMVSLGSVDNTADLAKPISSAAQTALDAKLNLAGGTLTGPLLLAADPTQALGVVTKQYADSISQGLHIHEAAQAATTANVDLSTGLVDSTVIDGVTLATGDRVLVKAQTDASENGIYVTAASGAASRALDFDEPLEMSGGDFVFVLGGTLYDNTGWVKTSGDVVTVGTDDLEFTQFSGAGSVTAGTNLEVSGTQISLAADPTLVDATITTLDVTNLVFPDGTTQTSAGVVSLTTFTEKTASYTLDALPHQDAVVEMNSGSATTFTIPANSTLAWPVGASMDIMQTGAGQVTVSGASGVTVNFTPGNKLRTQWSSCTIMKRSTDSWILFGDLTA